MSNVTAVHPHILAKLCQLSYKTPEESNSQWQSKLPKRLRILGAKDVNVFIKGANEAFACTIDAFGESHRIYVFRGTEPSSWIDLYRDLSSARSKVASPFGARKKVAKGFAAATTELWPQVQADMEQYPFRRTFAGHSLGGAIATIAAAEAYQAGHAVHDLFTIGSPRPGDPGFGSELETRIKLNDGCIMRMVCMNDPITSVPFSKFGFQHVTEPFYFTSHNKAVPSGDMRKPAEYTFWSMLLDRLYLWWLALPRPLTNSLKNHDCQLYITLIKKAFK